MSLGHGSSIVKNGLVLHLDAASNKSYPGLLGPELVTSSTITQIDGTTFNVLRDATQNITLGLCNVVSGKTYYVDYLISSYTGTTGATFRINGGAGTNYTPTIGIGSAGRFNRKFTANVSGSLSINGDNTGTNFNVDYVSVREVLSGTGTRWFDVSGKSNNGNLVNGPIYNNSTDTSLVFDGVDDYVDLGSNAAYNAISSITIEILFKRSSVGTSYYQVLFSNARDCCGVYNGFQMHIYNATVNPASLSCALWNANTYDGSNWATTQTAINLSNAIGVNTWYHVVCTYDLATSAYKGYINGAVVASTTKANALSTNQASFNLFLGKSPSHNSPVTGSIPIAKIYNRALSESEVKQNFEALRGRYGI
jgi:hypothetical protein